MAERSADAVAGEAEEAFFGGDGDAARFEDVGADGGVLMQINLGEAAGGVLGVGDSAAPEVAAILPANGELTDIVVTLLHVVTAAEIGDEAADDGGVGEALVDDFVEFLGGHGASSCKE